MTTLDELDKRLEHIEDVQENLLRNQGLQITMIRLILEELGLRKAIQKLDKEMETRNGSDAPPVVGG